MAKTDRHKPAIGYRKSLNDGRFSCVQYEDLTRYPEPIIRQLLGFLGEPYEQQCVNLKETENLHWNVDPHLFSDIQIKTKDWREHIDEEDAEYIESSLALPMNRLGYGRHT